MVGQEKGSVALYATAINKGAKSLMVWESGMYPARGMVEVCNGSYERSGAILPNDGTIIFDDSNGVRV